jgi:ribosomal protein L37E
MLQPMEQPQATAFISKRNIDINKIIPKVKRADALHSICTRCRFVNEASNNFCTNCGYPIKEKETSALFLVRMKQRKELLRKGEKSVNAARIVLYILSVSLLTGIGFLFGELPNRIFLVLASCTFSALFFLLAQWSYTKPFTALITAFILVITFSTILIFGEFVNAFTTVVGVYSLLINMVLVYFLLKGVQGAYKLDVAKEELEII